MANHVSEITWVGDTPPKNQPARRLYAAIGNTFEAGISWLVYTLFLPIAVLNGRAVRRCLLAILIIDIPLQVGTHLKFQQDAASLGSIPGFDVSLTTIALAGLYFSWWSNSLIRPDHRRQRLPHIGAWAVLYVLFVAISMLFARDLTLSLFEVFLLLQMLLLYIYISNNGDSVEDVSFVLVTLMIGLLLESLIMIAIVSGKTGPIMRISGHSVRLVSTSFGRIAGTMGSPNVAGGYLSMILAPTMSVLFTSLNRWYKGLAVLTFACGVVDLILTGSRGAWVACAVAMTIVYFFAAGRRRIGVAIAMAVNFVVIVALLFHDVILARWSSGVSSTGAESRLPLIKLAWEVIKDSPLFGVGANNFATVARDYVTPDPAWHEWFATVHNKYLVVWAETGLGGLLTFLAFLAITVRRLWRRWKQNDRLLSPLALGFMAGILGMMAHMLVDYFRARAVVQAFWLIAGLAAAMEASAARVHRPILRAAEGSGK